MAARAHADSYRHTLRWRCLLSTPVLQRETRESYTLSPLEKRLNEKTLARQGAGARRTDGLRPMTRGHEGRGARGRARGAERAPPVLVVERDGKVGGPFAHAFARARAILQSKFCYMSPFIQSFNHISHLCPPPAPPTVWGGWIHRAWLRFRASERRC